MLAEESDRPLPGELRRRVAVKAVLGTGARVATADLFFWLPSEIYG
jgi:hypothetical protein